jgi:hypothetical protein
MVSSTLNTCWQLQSRESAPKYGENHLKTNCEPRRWNGFQLTDFRSGESVQTLFDQYRFAHFEHFSELAYLTSSGISKADYYNLTLAEAGGLAVLAWGVKEE